MCMCMCVCVYWGEGREMGMMCRLFLFSTTAIIFLHFLVFWLSIPVLCTSASSSSSSPSSSSSSSSSCPL